MNRYSTEIMFIGTVLLVYLFSPFAYVRYYYEAFFDDNTEFFSDIAICAYNEKNNDYEVCELSMNGNTIYIPEKCIRYTFYFSGKLINGIKDVSVSVNNKQIDDVSLSFPQGNHFFWEHFYLVKSFSCDINLRGGSNIIIIKSGETTERIIVRIGSD